MCHQFGPNGDVKLIRSNSGTLTVEGGMGIAGGAKALKLDDVDLDEYMDARIRKIVKELLKMK